MLSHTEPRSSIENPRYERYIGIDYSGAATSDDPLPGLAIYEAFPNEPARRVANPNHGKGRWTRRAIALWLKEILSERCAPPTAVAIDHCFSLPEEFFTRHLPTPRWEELLSFVTEHWPLHLPGLTAEGYREEIESFATQERLRLCERWTSSAKSIFQLQGTGSVGKSSFCGMAWLWWLHTQLPPRSSSIHYWPFHGFDPPPRTHLIAESYPALFWRRFTPPPHVSVHERDAYALATWIARTDRTGHLSHYLNPPLTAPERRQARREGWILGVW